MASYATLDMVYSIIFLAAFLWLMFFERREGRIAKRKIITVCPRAVLSSLVMCGITVCVWSGAVRWTTTRWWWNGYLLTRRPRTCGATLSLYVLRCRVLSAWLCCDVVTCCGRRLRLGTK